MPIKTLSTRSGQEVFHSPTFMKGKLGIRHTSQNGEKSQQRSLAGLLPATAHSSVYTGGLNSSGVAVKYSKQIRRITLQRYLVSKLVWQPEIVTFPELLALYDNLLWCQDKASMDPGFLVKFGTFLENVTKVLKSCRFDEKSYKATARKLSTLLREAGEGHLIPERNLLGVERHLKGKYTVIATKSTGIPNKSLPPVKVIGRGYRDKGTCRDPAWDGSPSWQDVATYFSNMEDST